MSHRDLRSLLTLGTLVAGIAAPASASFHLMKIQQATGGVCGDVSSQAIELRMRSGGQNQVGGTRLVAYDAAGLNPVILISTPSNVPVSTAGSRILYATASFIADHTPPVVNFTLANPIPASYLAAGRLTFEDSGGSIYWSLAWGGANYTGPNTGTFDNDADGDFGAAFPGEMSRNTSQAIFFPGAAATGSTNNAADFQLTAGAAVFTNNAGATIPLPDCIFGDGFEVGGLAAWSSNTP